MMRTVFVFFYFSLLGSCLSLQCFHCIDEKGVCKHRFDFYPPVSYCGYIYNAHCAVVELRLHPYMNSTQTGRLWMSFAGKTGTVRFRGCVKEDYCEKMTSKAYQRIGIAMNFCKICSTHYCNSGSNLIPFFVIKLLIFGIAVPYLLFYF
ncbi:hypothetical protein ILUMI_12531 [Ignelater luminosus]|uniref:Protein quiver n=1 Tax=Ignelater luminosus TaxID=2038154 RepID=A0A8K0GC81_IGNLU|nr:hypothetical protein ILUMI_12531 [Ignelater luminosus]